ncbi:MAG: hypothetical protein PVI99_01235 [Anaerolineales bacterium]|jgi:hypothetical protein
MMGPKEEIRRFLSEEAAVRLIDKLEKLQIADPGFENQIAFAAAALMLGECAPSASVAMGVVKSIEDTDMFRGLALIGQALPYFSKQEPIGDAVGTVVLRGLEQIAVLLMKKANSLEKEE